ncbi:MAG: hypothetical protein ACI9Y1_000348 [Lentisphaeria bacterium]
MKHRPNKTLHTNFTLVADEGISEEICSQLQDLLLSRGYTHLKRLMIAQQYPGMSDGQIIHYLLNSETLLLTSDRPLHNTVLSRELLSYYYSDGRFTREKIPGIHTLPAEISAPKQQLHATDSPQQSYEIEEPEIRHCLLPESKKALKQL